jgi:4-aminobutyrate aminotransferase
MIGVELVDAAGAPSVELAGEVLEHAREGGVLIGRGGLHGNVLRIAPPLTLTLEEAEQGAAVLARALRTAAGASA